MFFPVWTARGRAEQARAVQEDRAAREVAELLPADLHFHSDEREKVREQLREARMNQGIQWSSTALLM
eukprot:scaffold317_cov260-Pinguiococcus_pyrenoidosus.AAC.25